MNCSMPSLPVHHQLLEFAQTHVHQVHDAIQPSHPLSSPSPPTPNPPQYQSFTMSQLFAWGGQSTGVSALASFFPKNAQGWSPLFFVCVCLFFHFFFIFLFIFLIFFVFWGFFFLIFFVLISFRMDWLDLLAVHGLSRVISNTTVQKHQFFGTQLSSQSNSHIHTWPLEKSQPWLDRALNFLCAPLIHPSLPPAAKSLQSCLTLCDPIDGSSPGSPIPGILQARILEWVAITVFIALLFLERHIDRIILYVAFSDWLLSLSNMHLKSSPTHHLACHFAPWLAHFLRVLNNILLVRGTTA